MKHKLLLPFFILIFSNYYYAQLMDTVKNPAEDYVKSFETDSLLENPSMHNICKITADFNCDGIQDIAITDSYLCGAHACYWDIYLGIGDMKYKYFSTLWFHNYAIQIDSVADGISNIYIYDKAGGGVGDIIEYNLSLFSGINEINRKTIYPETYPENEDYEYYIKIFTQPALIDSCINILNYLETNKINWKTGYF